MLAATGEANRLIAWIVRHCGQSSVMTTVARAGSVPLLCSMMHGDYAIMQNEALVALTLMAGSCLGQRRISLQHSSILCKVEVVIGKKDRS